MVERENLFDRVRALVESRYGCQIYFFDSSTSTTRSRFGESDIAETVKRNSGSQMIMVHGDLVLPFEDQGKFLGYAVVMGGGQLEWREMEEIRQTVELVSKSVHIRSNEPHAIEAVENYLEDQLLAQKVYEISQHPSFSNKGSDSETDSESSGSGSSSSLTTEAHYLVEDKDPERIRRFAIDIHEKLKRQALISLSDFSPELILNVEDFQSLGPITVVIPQLDLLPQETRKNCEQYLRSKLSITETPLLIMGVCDPVDALVDQQKLNKDYLQMTNVSHVRLSDVVLPKNGREIYKTLIHRSDTNKMKHLVVVPEVLH